jgi:heme/copper-type cytochrome/quinol oxidase subunit 3
VFAYFYLRSLDTNKDWKIGHNINPSIGLGVAIVVALVLSAAALRAASVAPERAVRAGAAALLLAVLAVVLQVIAWTKLGFGPASGGYASVYIGWTAFYSVFALFCAYWIETQVATVWRRRRHGVPETPAEVMTDTVVTRAGLEACSFFWTFYVASGVLAFVVLYLL